MTKISGYSADSSPTTDDYFITVDATSGLNKKVTLQDLKTLLVGGAWNSFTPTATNFTLGNGTMTGKYTLTGKTVYFELKILFGSTTSTGTDPQFTVPVAAASRYSSTAGVLIGIGLLTLVDDSAGASYYGATTFGTSDVTKFRGAPMRGDGTWLYNGANSITVGQPAAGWATNDIFLYTGQYEAA